MDLSKDIEPDLSKVKECKPENCELVDILPDEHDTPVPETYVSLTRQQSDDHCYQAIDGGVTKDKANNGEQLSYKTENVILRIIIVALAVLLLATVSAAVYIYLSKQIENKTSEATKPMPVGSTTEQGDMTQLPVFNKTSDATTPMPMGYTTEQRPVTLLPGKESFQLNFLVAPVNKSLKRGQSHVEECALDVPVGVEVQYNWTLNGTFIEAYGKMSGFGTFPGGLLKIDKFTDRLEGQYSCFASTSAGRAEHTFEYRIVEDCDVRIYPGPQSESKKINENALLICHVDSRAKEVRWKKDGVYIDFGNNPRFKKYTNNYLGIKDIGLSDAGMYTCEAEDNYGCHSYKEGKLTVIDLKPLSKYCGISVYDEAAMASTRISKGKDARPDENPWHVTINTKNDRTFCGGTLISQNYILTAAHCIKGFEEFIKLPWEPENVYILLGTTNCSRKGGETIRTFKGSPVIHPDYGKRAMHDSDIALIELDSPVEYTDSIRPICLEPGDYNDRVFLENSDSLSPIPGKVAGCGKRRAYSMTATRLQEVYLLYVRREDCEESLDRTRVSITDRMFCAGSNIARTGDTCGGDNGGGLVMAASGRWVQTGIVSWAVGGCDRDKYYGVYTNVGKFYDWIEGITKFSEEEGPDFTGQF